MTVKIMTDVSSNSPGANPVNDRLFHFTCFGNFSGSNQARQQWEPIPVNTNSWDQLFQTLKPSIDLHIQLPETDDLRIKLQFSSLRDFSVKGLRASIPFLSQLKALIDRAASTSENRPLDVPAFLKEHPELARLEAMVGSGEEQVIDLLNMIDLGEDEDDNALNLPQLKSLLASKTYDGSSRSMLCAELGQVQKHVMDQILEDPGLNALHGRWRALKHFLRLRHIKLNLIDCLKGELCDATFLTYVKPQSGQPLPIDLGFYCDEFADTDDDRHIIFHLGRMAESVMIPFILNGSYKLFDVKAWRHLTHVRDISGKLSSPARVKWRKLRNESGSHWLYLTVNPFLLDESDEAVAETTSLTAPSSFYAALLMGEGLADGAWPSQILHPGSQLDIAHSCLARLDEEQGYDLSFEGLCGVSGRENGDRLYLLGMLGFGQVTLPAREQLKASNLVEYTLPYRFFSGCCSRYLAANEHESDIQQKLQDFAGVTKPEDFSFEQDGDQTIYRLRAPFQVFGVHPDLILALG